MPRSAAMPFSPPTHPASPARYDLLARSLHWIFAIGILYATAVGYALHIIPEGEVHDFLSRLNMSLATVLIVLFPLRLLWRMMRREPAPPPGLAAAQVSLARRTQHLIYLTILGVLVSGYLMVPDHYRLFGLLTIPTPFAKGAITEAWFIAHRVSCGLLTALVALHLAGVVVHTWVRPSGPKGLLGRML